MNKLTHLRHKQQGFTLVEIAIVLVIIGLLLGAVFKGQELIGQAKVKNAAKQFDEVRAAYYTYLDKNNAVPGDSGATSGGDGLINSSIWTDLGAEHLIPGNSAPKNPYGVALVATSDGTKNWVCSKITKSAAEQIDRKTDDNALTTGSFVTLSADPTDGGTSITIGAPGSTATDDTLVWACASL